MIVLASLAVLEAARWGVQITHSTIGTTPVITYALPGSEGPPVVVAHGFAGSQQMMQGYALPLARAGYVVSVYEFEGHGRNPTPMSGDVDQIAGTTQLLVDQTHAVIDAVARGDTPVTLIGHSMATDILVRVAAMRADIGPVVLISAFSQEIDAATPKDMLLITGAWEAGLRAFAREAVQMVDPNVTEGETAQSGDIRRRAFAAPFSEHVSILHARSGRAAALDWLAPDLPKDLPQSSPLAQAPRIYPTGWAILGLLGGLVMVFVRLARRLPERPHAADALSLRQISLAVGLPMLAAPVLATQIDTGVLPVLVADYLLVHLLIFGALQLALLWRFGHRPGHFSALGFAVLGLGCVLFGMALDRYAANFWPTVPRIWIIACLMLGAVPYMLSDAMITLHAKWPLRAAIRTGFLLSLALAVTLEFERLFFLIMIAPVLVLFYLVFGTMGRAVAWRKGPLCAGLALGLTLAWALGVSFPLFQI
ncbi:MAG: alpha/beta hydrolase [Roseovarius sp.]